MPLNDHVPIEKKKHHKMPRIIATHTHKDPHAYTHRDHQTIICNNIHKRNFRLESNEVEQQKKKSSKSRKIAL